MLKLKSSKHNYAINVPTKLSEISNDYLLKTVKSVNLSENYAIVAVILSTKLTDFCFSIANSNNKDSKFGASVVFVKANPSKDVTFKAKVGDYVIIRDEELSRSLHLSTSSVLTTQSVGSYIAADSNLNKAIVTGELKDESGNRIGDNIIRLLQFKIIPINDIHAVSEPTAPTQDDFVVDVTPATAQ